MARMHSNGKGQSLAMKPFSTVPPTNLNVSVSQIEKEIIHLAKRGNGPSVIGKVLRDNYGIGNCQDVLGLTILQFLKKNNAEPSIPEDLSALIEKSQIIKSHLSIHKKDNDAKYRLNLVNSRLHRLLRYYKTKGVMPRDFKVNK